jgi:hypothetical protein
MHGESEDHLREEYNHRQRSEVFGKKTFQNLKKNRTFADESAKPLKNRVEHYSNAKNVFDKDTQNLEKHHKLTLLLPCGDCFLDLSSLCF